MDGLRFEDVLVSFPDAIPCGIKVAADGGKIIINPDDKYVLKEGDEVLVIAEDDDTYAPSSLPEVTLSFLDSNHLYLFRVLKEKKNNPKPSFLVSLCYRFAGLCFLR